MDWGDIACIVFICTTVNHLGLIAKIEGLLKKEIPVVNCSKCFTCWSVMAYLVITGCHPLASFAISLLCSYIALWLELFMYAIDIIYNRIYGTIKDFDPEEGKDG